MGSIDPMMDKQRNELLPCLPIIVSMSPPTYPSAWLRPGSSRLGFTWQDSL